MLLSKVKQRKKSQNRRKLKNSRVKVHDGSIVRENSVSCTHITSLSPDSRFPALQSRGTAVPIGTGKVVTVVTFIHSLLSPVQFISES